MMSDLNSFETRLLDDLKRRQPVPRPRHGMIALGSAALAATVVAGVVAANALAPAPAYAVEETGAGDIRITLTSLSDAPGLEAELAKHGIDAEVRYDAGPATTRPADSPSPDPGGEGTSAASGSGWERIDPDGTRSTSSADGSRASGEGFADSCGVDPAKAPSVRIETGRAVISIPAGSIPDDRELEITTTGDGGSFAGLSASWTGPDGECGVGSASVGTPANR